MQALELKILNKRQELRDLLVYATRQAPVYLPIIRAIKFEIAFCDHALDQLYSRRAIARSS